MQLSVLLRTIFSARTDRMYPVLVARFLQVADFIWTVPSPAMTLHECTLKVNNAFTVVIKARESNSLIFPNCPNASQLASVHFLMA